jgi:hypothetical protein
MHPIRIKERTKRLLAGLAVTIILFCHVATISAQDRCWSTGGSTGTVDDADLSLFTLTDNTAAISGAITAATGDIRYNVVAVDGLFSGERGTKTLTVRFADNGPAAQVLVRLQRVHIFTGVLTTLVELNSNDYPSSTVAQTRSETFNCDSPGFDFENHIYYIEATLIKTGAAGTPLIRSIQLCPGIC